MILNTSDYFNAQQGQLWQPRSLRAATTNTREHGASTSSCDALAARPTVHLTIANAEQLTAAEAVIAAMYGVPGAVTSLQQQQLVHVIVIADMVHAGAAQQQAVQALQAAAESEQGLSAAALQALAGQSVWPSCLLQLLATIIKHAPCCKNNAADLAAVAAADDGGSMRQVLVTVFGDLQAVWADEETSRLLLGLPLPAMPLLLSSDQLRVPSEDTVLYTAKRYVRAQTDAVDEAKAKAALGPLIRAPQLSLFALSCAVLPADSDQQLLGCYARQLKDLLSLKRIASAAKLPEESAAIEGAPACWQTGARQNRLLEDGVRLEWRLPVERLKQACRESFPQQDRVWLHSPGSPPLGGMAWKLWVMCKQEDGGTILGMYAAPVQEDLPPGSYYKLTFTVKGHDVERRMTSSCLKGFVSSGYQNFFTLQPMAGGGWDEAVWAAAGLPATGEMLLQLHVHSVE